MLDFCTFNLVYLENLNLFFIKAIGWDRRLWKEVTYYKVTWGLYWNSSRDRGGKSRGRSGTGGRQRTAAVYVYETINCNSSQNKLNRKIRLEKRSWQKSLIRMAPTTRVSGPDPHGSGLIWVDGSGSRRAKMTHKNRKTKDILCFEGCWMFSFEGWRLLL